MVNYVLQVVAGQKHHIIPMRFVVIEKRRNIDKFESHHWLVNGKWRTTRAVVDSRCSIKEEKNRPVINSQIPEKCVCASCACVQCTFVVYFLFSNGLIDRSAENRQRSTRNWLFSYQQREVQP